MTFGRLALCCVSILLLARASADPDPGANIVEKDVRYERRLWDNPSRPVDAERFLNGPHSFQFRVVDEVTGELVRAYRVQALVLERTVEYRGMTPEEYAASRAEHEEWMKQRRAEIEASRSSDSPPLEEEDNESEWEEEEFEEIEPRPVVNVLGSLETQDVDDPSGSCAYERLGEGDYEFQIFAEGTFPHIFSVHVPFDGVADFKLARSRSVKGALAWDPSGKPLAGVELRLAFPPENQERHHRLHHYVAMTDEKGAFAFGDLPPDRYEFSMASRMDLRTLQRKVGEDTRRSAVAEGRRATSEEILERFERAKREPYPMPPVVTPIDLVEDLVVDLGTIPVSSYPGLEIEVVREDRTPLRDFTYEVRVRRPAYSGVGTFWESIQRGKTDSEGRAFAPLLGIAPDGEAMVCAPASHESPVSSGEESERYRNAIIVSPKPSAISTVQVVYRPGANDVSLRLKVVRASDQSPVREFKGVVAYEPSDLRSLVDTVTTARSKAMRDPKFRSFEWVDDSGVVVISEIPLSPNILGAEAEIRRLLERGPEESFDGAVEIHADALESARSRSMIGVLLQAPGFADRTFQLDLAEVRKSATFTLEMEPEAVVVGRVMGSTGEPVTMARVVEDARELGRPEGSTNPESAFATPSVQLVRRSPDFMNANLEFLHWSASCGPDGSFRIPGILPSEGWTLVIEFPGLPAITRRELALVEGTNDLGEFRMGFSANFEGRFEDEAGLPVAGAEIRFPLEQMESMLEREGGNRSDALGAVRFPLDFVRGGDRQIVRVIPPWGFDPKSTNIPKDAFLWHDAVMPIDRVGGSTLSAKLHRGNPLTVELALDDVSRAFLAECEDPAAMGASRDVRPELDKQGEPFFAIRRIAIVAAHPDGNGLFFHEAFEARPEVRIGEEAPRIEVPNVPPGPLALRIDGGWYGMEDDIVSGEPKSEVWSETTIPLAYDEFAMPDAPHVRTLRVASSRVTVRLSDPPEGRASAVGTLAFLERDGPQAVGIGNEIKRVISSTYREGGRDPESWLSPLLSYFGYFTKDVRVDGESRMVRTEISPAVFHAVPPGDYVLRVHTDVIAMLSSPEPYHERRIHVGPDTNLEIEVPYRAR